MPALREYVVNFWTTKQEYAKVYIQAPSQPDAKKLAAHLKDSMSQLGILPQGGVKTKVTKYPGWW